ncbi:Crp/Fnr family transcriptional regulator [Burkholderia pseudomallei]|uniref:Crp/Fnr family transcriptional regulator n=1 Tax=Burkholderia pseudomallei TaxID=28450 RepID=UPI000F08CA3B|nr:Crp/Fnr family transcriptional regulator [Burkholderia pseudomallei]VBV82224.1 cyclic nucleotide-binding domain-containing protein [Burkholderia pseudomallei]
MKESKIPVQDFLARLPLFSVLSCGELDNLARGTMRVQVPRGQTVFSRGDPCGGFHMIVYGQIKLSSFSPLGIEKIVRLLGPGDSFGEAVMFMDKPYAVTAKALSDTLLLYVTKAVVTEELDHNPAFARRMLASLSMRLHQLVVDVETYSLRSGTQRVISYLLEQTDAPVESGMQIRLETGKKAIASRLNLTPEHFSRVLRDLCTRELVVVNGRDIFIPDVDRLRSEMQY